MILFNASLNSFLEIVPHQDAFTTPCFFGIIYGNELAKLGSDNELKSLILKRLKMAYKNAVQKVENIKL